MASATGIPETTLIPQEGTGEDEPLLGRAGDAAQHDGSPIYYNLIIGTSSLSFPITPPNLISRYGSHRSSWHPPPHSLRLGQRLPQAPDPLLRPPSPKLRRSPRPHTIHPPTPTNTHPGTETPRNSLAFPS